MAKSKGTSVDKYIEEKEKSTQQKMLEQAQATQKSKAAESAEKKASFRKFFKELVKSNPHKTKAWYMRRFFEAGYSPEQFEKVYK